MSYPPLPDVIHAPAGPVTVLLGLNLVGDDGEPADGHYEEALRVITIDASAPERWRWYTFFHEWAHVALTDSGLENLFDERTVEALCDCIATARMRERFG